MTKRNIIIAVSAVLVTAIAVTVIVAVNKGKGNDKTEEHGKNSSEYSETVNNISGNETANNTDIINVGKDVEEEKEDLEAADTDKSSSKVNNSSSEESSSAASSSQVSKPNNSSNPDNTGNKKDAMTGWSAWE